MHLTTIGKIFLKEYNARNNSSLTAKKFFNDIFFPLFFNHEKYLMWVVNTPFTIAKEVKKPIFKTKEYKLKALATFNKKIEQDKEFSMNVVVGGSASDNEQTTSALFDSCYFKTLSTEDKYLSWIGHALGICVEGGLIISFQDPKLLYLIYEGWRKYRTFLNDEAFLELKGNQINTWNGVWVLLNLKSSDFTDSDISQLIHVPKKAAIKTSEFKTVPWTGIILNLHNLIRDENIYSYVYKLGQLNTSIGIIPIKVEEVRRPMKYYIKMFGLDDYILNKDQIENHILGSNYFGFDNVCEYGNIGVMAVKPVDIFENNFDAKIKKYKINTKLIKPTLKAWIMAVINKEEILKLSEDLSNYLKEYVNSDKKGKTEYSNKATQLLEKNNKTIFFKELSEINKNLKPNAELAKELKDSVHFMDNDMFKYFIALVSLTFNN